MLGSRADTDDIVRAFEKVYEHRDALNAGPRVVPVTRESCRLCRTVVSFAALTALGENTYLSAIRAGMVSVVPLTIVGGLFMIARTCR